MEFYWLRPGSQEIHIETFYLYQQSSLTFRPETVDEYTKWKKNETFISTRHKSNRVKSNHMKWFTEKFNTIS